MPVATPAQMAGALRAAGFTGTDIVTGVAVGMAESSGKTDATNHNTNGSTDYGVWQINSIHRDALAMGSWADLNTNARMAKLVFDQAGHSWRPWVTFNTGAYRQYMNQGMSGAGNPAPSPTAQPVDNPISGLTAGLSFMTDPHNWLRLAEFVAGFVVLLVALYRSTGIDTGKVASTAIKVAAVTG